MTYLWNHPEQDRPIGSQGVYPDHLGFVMGPTSYGRSAAAQPATGKGVTIDLAQIEGTAYTLGVTYLDASINGDDPQPKGNAVRARGAAWLLSLPRRRSLVRDLRAHR